MMHTDYNSTLEQPTDSGTSVETDNHASDKTPVVIVGGGLAGLCAAAFLKQHGIPFRLFEASSQLAGLMASERDEEGFTYDCGAHFLTNRLAAAVGCSSICRHMDRYGESVLVRGKHYSYPFGLVASPRFLFSALWSKLTGLFKSPPVTAMDFYTQAYGAAIAREIAVPLTSAWSGVDGDHLSASVGQKFSTGMLKAMYLVLMKKMTGRTIGIGYSGTFPEATSVWHVYPEGGIKTVCDILAEKVKEHIQTNSPVQAIVCEGDQVRGVEVKGEFVPASSVISTAPLHILAKIVRGTQKLDYLKKFEYRAMIFVNIRLQGQSNLPDVVTWTPEDRFPFFRISDIGLGLPFLVPEGKTQITCDIGCKVGDENWTASDETLTQMCMDGLEQIVPGIRAKFLGSRIVKTGLAYPIFKVDYEAERKKFQLDTGIDGLISVGRNGEFDHILMEDVYWRTRRKLIPLVSRNIVPKASIS